MPEERNPTPFEFVERLFGRGKCWIWPKFLDANGYGRLRFDGRMHKPHRVAYELFVGPDPRRNGD